MRSTTSFLKKRRRCSPCRYCLMLFTVFASHAVFVPVFDTISTFDDDSISWGYTVSISWGKHCSHNICLGIYHRLIASPSCDDSISQYLVTVSISGYSVAMALGSDPISWYQITIFISSYTVSVSVSITWLLVMTQFHSICFWLNFIVLVLKLHKLHSICLMRHEPVFSIYRDWHYLHCICLIIYIYIYSLGKVCTFPVIVSSSDSTSPSLEREEVSELVFPSVMSPSSISWRWSLNRNLDVEEVLLEGSIADFESQCCR